MKLAALLLALNSLFLGSLKLAAQTGQSRPEIPAPYNKNFHFRPEIILTKPDVFQLDQKHYKLEFENEKVRVLRVKLGRDESGPMHDAAAAVLVCVSECHVRFTRPDGKVQDVHMEAGQTRWIWDDNRSEKNLSTHPVEMLFIETKQTESQ